MIGKRDRKDARPLTDDVQTARPRLARARDEFRGLGSIGLGIALCTVGWWAAGFALVGDVRLVPTGVAALAGLALALAAVGPLTRRRVRAAVRVDLPPPGSVYETPAAANLRRARLALAVVLGPLLLLMLDRVVRGGGEMAGFLVGLFAGYAVLALGEAGVWARRERREGHMLYVLVRPSAMMAPLATTEVYERPIPQPDEASPFDRPV